MDGGLMQPSEGFWEGVGAGIADSPGWMLVTALLVACVTHIVAKYVVPSHERVRMKRIEIEQRQAETDAERVRANAMLAEQQRQTNVLIDGMRQSLDASTAHTDVLVAELRGSRDRSHEMGERVEHIDQTTSHTDTLVEDIHRHIIGGGEGTD